MSTVSELLKGKELDYPHMTGRTFKRAPRHVAGIHDAPTLFEEEPGASEEDTSKTGV